jgi:hypothetical protein
MMVLSDGTGMRRRTTTMFPWKRKAVQPLATEDDLPGFTGAERARLQFARWLVRHGRLSEGMEGQEAAWAPQLSQAPLLLRTALASSAMTVRTFRTLRRSHPRSPVEATTE